MMIWPTLRTAPLTVPNPPGPRRSRCGHAVYPGSEGFVWVRSRNQYAALLPIMERVFGPSTLTP
jgi:hypothetical protein